MANYLPKNHQKEMTEILEHILGDTFILYFKTHAYHWNVEGPNFDSLHTLFGTQYTDMWTAMDGLAERIRALGGYAPLNITEMTKNSDLKEAKKIMTAIDMVKDLAQDHAKISKHIAEGIEKASEVGDEVTADMLIARQAFHDKTTWMLNATAA